MAKSFKLGNQTLEFNWDTEEYSHLHNKFFTIHKSEYEKFQNTLKQIHFGVGFSDKVESLCYKYIINLYSPFSDEYLAKGKYSFSVENFAKSSDFQRIMQPVADCIRKLRSDLLDIEHYKDSEALHREMRKDSRGRIVGGGFGVSGAVKGMAIAGTINAATGIAHSIYNTFDEASTNQKADQAEVTISRRFVDEITELIPRCGISLLHHIRKDFGINVNFDVQESFAIKDNIKKGVIKEDFQFQALTKALQAYPYHKEVYYMIIEKYPEYSDDLIIIADHFKVNIKELYILAHELDGVYFNNMVDKQFAVDNISSKLNAIQNKYTDIKNNIEFVDECLNFLDTVQIPEGKEDIQSYLSNRKDAYIKLRKKFKLQIIPKYEAVDALVNCYDDNFNGIIDDNLYSYNAIPNSFFDIIMKFDDTLHREELCFVLDASYFNNTTFIAITLDKIYVIKENSHTCTCCSLNDYEIIKLENGRLDFTSNGKNELTTIAEGVKDPDITLDNYRGSSDKFNHLMEQIFDPHKHFPNIVLRKLIKKHEVTGEAASYEEILQARLNSISEFKEIRQLTNHRILTADPELLKSWYTTLSDRNFVSEKAAKAINRIKFLLKVNHADLRMYNALEKYLPLNRLTLIANLNYFDDLQQILPPSSNNQEIALLKISKNTVLTTQNLYYNGTCTKLSEILYITHVKDQLVIIRDKEELSLQRDWINFPTLDEEVLKCEKFLNQALKTFLIVNIAEYKSILLSERYYFFNKIFNNLITLSNSLNYKSIYNGTDVKFGENETKARMILGKTNYIFRFIVVPRAFGEDRGMGLVDSGLYFWLLKDNEPWALTWKQLANSTITTKKQYTHLYIDNTEYPMGLSDAECDDWANYLNYMVAAYRLEMRNYPLYASEIENMSKSEIAADIAINDLDGSHTLDGVYFENIEDMNFVYNHIVKVVEGIQKKYVYDDSPVFNNKDYFIQSLNFSFINEIITVLDNVSVEPEQIHVLEYIENKKQFYIPLRNEMKEIYDKKSIDNGLLNIQAKFLNATDNAYSYRDYFLNSLNFPFIDELIAYLEGVTVEPENNKLREYIEEKKQFYFQLRNEMEGLATKKSIDDGLLKIQANYSTETYSVLSDRNYFIESRNLPFINAIITFLNEVTVKPEESALLEYIEDKKKFYLPLQKEVEEFCAECEQIEEITKGRFFSTNVEELKSWNDALSKKEFHTPRATEIVTTIQLLASYSQKDLDTLVLVISMLPRDNGVTTINENNFAHIQKQFTSRVKDNEIVLSYTGNGFAVDSWMLTTQRFYIATVGYNLADILTIICIDNYLLVIAQPEDKNQAKRTYLINFGFDKTQLLNITKSLSAICHKYLEKNLPETSSKYLTYEYYFYNDIMPNLINKSQSYYFVSVHDGTNAPIDYQIRKVSGRDTFIFRYITSTGAGNKGMALTDQGLIIEQPFDANKTLLKWEELVNADIYVKKKGFFSKDEMFINGQTYSLGNSDAKTEDWVSYLRNMIAAYKLCIMNYPIFIQKIQSLPNFPPLKDTPSLQHIVYIPPQPVPTPSESTSTVTNTPNTPDNKNETKSSMFSSFKSSIMSTSKSALDKAADIGAKTSSSFASSFMNKTKSAFGIGKDDGTKSSENTSPNIEEPEPVSSSKNIDGDKVCPNCGASLAKDQLFCGKCGTKYVDTQNKKLCPSCGAEVEDGMKFCRICGAKLNVNQPKFCPNCGSKLAEGTKFCGNCGNKV